MGQVWRITLGNLVSLRQRSGEAVVVCIGIGGVVAVLISVLAMATSLEDSLQAVGRPDRAIVVREGSQAEMLSSLTPEELSALDNAPGIVTAASPGAAGGERRRISPEVVWSETFERTGGRGRGAASIRGITPAGRAVHDEIIVSEGRDLRPGLRELVVGAMAAREFEHLSLGDEPFFLGTRWKVVGIFTSGDPGLESDVRRIADEVLVENAIEQGILDRAEENAQSVLTDFLLSVGYTDVVVDFEEPEPTS